MKKIYFLLISISTFLFLSCGIAINSDNNAKTSEETTIKETTVNSDSKITEGVKNTEQNNSLEATILKVVNAYKNRDEATLNSLLLSDFSLGIVHRPGAFDSFEFVNAISFANPVPSYYPYNTNIVNTGKVKFEALPQYDCGTGKWDKAPGIYCDTVNKNNTLSFITEFASDLSAAKIKEIKKIEKISHEVTVINKNPNDTFTFYLSSVVGKWYLTVIYRSIPCSA